MDLFKLFNTLLTEEEKGIINTSKLKVTHINNNYIMFHTFFKDTKNTFKLLVKIR